MFLDTFAETGDDRGGTLDLVVRAAASLAGRYLASRDRVGLVGFGGYLTWLYPAGERARRLWQLERETLRVHYQRLGAPVAEWQPEEPLEIPIEEVRRFQRRLRHARA